MTKLIKDKRGFLTLEHDMEVVMAAFTKSKSRLADKALAALMDEIYDQVYNTLTEYGEWFIDRCGDLEPFEAIRQAQALTKRDRRKS